MRRLAILLLALGLPLAAGAQTASPAVRVGDTYADVVAKLGPPSSEMAAGANRLLVYPAARIKIRDGQVAEIYPVSGSAPSAGPPASLAATPPSGGAGGPAPKPAAGTEGIRARKDAIETEIADFEFAVLQDFRKENFTALEAQAEQLIATRATFGDGSWKIMSFNQALGIPDRAPEQDWSNVEQKIGRWENALPKSVTARVAHVSFLTAYAWHARGGVIPAAHVAPEALSKFEARMTQAQALLQTAMGLGPKSPMLWYVGLNVALGRHWSLQDTANFYIQGKQYAPGFWYLDTEFALYISPHWNGKEGDWEDFAQAELERSGSLGTEAYARIVFSMKPYYRNIFKETKAQWPEVRDGFQTLMRKYPQSMQLVNEYAYMACNAGDRAAARWAFDRMGNFVDPFIWTTESLRVLRGWAYQPQ